MTPSKPTRTQRAALAVGLVVAFVMLPLWVRPLIDNFSNWHPLHQAFPETEAADVTWHFRTLYIGETRHTLSVDIGVSDRGLHLNYRLLWLGGSSPSMIPWESTHPHEAAFGASNWVVVGADPEVWIPKSLAAELKIMERGAPIAP